MSRPLLSDGLAALIHGLSKRAGTRPVVEEIRSRPWASITFSGFRHDIALRFEGRDAGHCVQRMTDGLDYAEFDLGKYLLIDIAVSGKKIDGEDVVVTLEALIIEND